MTTRSPARDTRFRLGWLVLLVMALLARSTAPEGWMPVVNAAGGIEIAVCNGMAPVVLSKDGTLHEKAPAKGQPAEHVCAFAGVAIADTPPLPAIVAPARAAIVAPMLERIVLTSGRGLAAPPPPATGPPALA